MTDLIHRHPVAFWSGSVVLGLLVLFVIVFARSRAARQGTGKQPEIMATAAFLVMVVVPALVAILLAGLLPSSLWRIGSIVLPAAAVLLGLKYWTRLQATRHSRGAEKKHAR